MFFAPPAPVLSIAQVDSRDAGIYTAQIAALNAAMKTKVGVDPFLRLYLGRTPWASRWRCSTARAATRHYRNSRSRRPGGLPLAFRLSSFKIVFS